MPAHAAASIVSVANWSPSPPLVVDRPARVRSMGESSRPKKFVPLAAQLRVVCLCGVQSGRSQTQRGLTRWSRVRSEQPFNDMSAQAALMEGRAPLPQSIIDILCRFPGAPLRCIPNAIPTSGSVEAPPSPPVFLSLLMERHVGSQGALRYVLGRTRSLDRRRARSA